MKVLLKRIDRQEEEHAVICCYEVNDDIKSIAKYIKTTGELLCAYVQDEIKHIALNDIYYVEAVDDKVFAYTKNSVYEIKCRLYEFVEQYEKRRFFRCSKSYVINLMKIERIQPYMNGRLSARLTNNEEIVISRQYVPLMKKMLQGEKI
ncbi:MAG: LytTR family DNA-binding domain-containing protein [Clostridia bacterium]